MPPDDEGALTFTQVILGIAIVLLVLLLLLALWSFFQGTLGFGDAFGVAGFCAVMVGVLTWASLLVRTDAEADRTEGRLRYKAK